MDENKPRRRWLSFGIRDLLWAMALLAMGLGWWVDRSRFEGELRAKDSAHLRSMSKLGRQVGEVGYELRYTMTGSSGSESEWQLVPAGP